MSEEHRASANALDRTIDWSYTLAKVDDGWRIVSFSGHPPNKVVRCDVEN